MRTLVALGLCVLAAGCATTGADPTSVSAQGMYEIAEAHYAHDDFPAAASMMRHAIVNLPETERYDHLRHQLLLRMAHTQLRAFHSTGDSAFLVDAQRMLYRYVARHEAMFGDGKKARAERGECYELLYEVESRIDAVAAAPPGAAVDDIEVAVHGGEPEPSPPPPTVVTDTEAPNEPEVASEREATAPTFAAAEPTPEVVAPGTEPADEEGVHPIDAPIRRRVHVRTAKRPDVNDPITRMKLRSAFSDASAGFVLGRGSLELVHGPRPLVRMSGLARVADGRGSMLAATALGHRFVASARKELRACYDKAFARRPVGATTATVELTVDASGQVHKPRIVDGRVVDGIGDLCVVQVAALARVTNPPKSAIRVRVPLTFFYEGAVVMSEGSGSTLPATHVGMLPAAGPYDLPTAPDGLPPIDRHNRSGWRRGGAPVDFFP